MLSKYPDVVSVNELKEILRVGKNTIYKLLQDNTIKSIKIGKKYIIPKSSIINFLNTSEYTTLQFE